MKNLITALLLILIIPMLFVNAQSMNTDYDNERELTMIKSLLEKKGIKINCSDYIFYYIGDYRIPWSMMTMDSIGINIYHGTMRERDDSEDPTIPDTLSFIKDNIKTITWGFDSLVDFGQFSPLEKELPYNKSYYVLYIVKDGKIFFVNDTRKVYYSGAEDSMFWENFKNLSYLMFWLAYPDLHPYMPVPSDT